MNPSSKAWFFVLGVPLAAACNGNGKLRVDGRLSETSAAQASESSLPVGDGNLVIERASVAVSEIEFEGGEEESDELEASVGGGIIDLALDGSKTTVAADTVESGVYHTLGLELRGNSSITVVGTYGGTAFTYVSGLSPELEFPLRPAVEVPAGGEASVGVEFDVAAWFVVNGAAVDPSNEANRSLIEDNILASMKAHAEVEEGDDGPDDD
jgi:hypothetical protein